MAAFVQGPEQYLKDLGISMACVVEQEVPAILDADHRVFLNYESYYFSSGDARQQFLGAPHTYAGRITDVVTRERFVATAESPRREHDGRLFLFSTTATAARFDEAPDDYATPMLAMVPVAE